MAIDIDGTNGISSTSGNALAASAISQVLQVAYPVGSIYINATNATNPSALLGFGTWAAFGAGRVPVGFDAGNALFDTAEETGGSANAIVVSHTHSGTTDSAGTHTHTVPVADVNGRYTATGEGGAAASTSTTGSAGAHTHTFTTASTGSSGTNANYQPYITVYMWKRTA